MREIRFISTCRGAKEETPLYASLNRLGVGSRRFFEHNQRGLPECYNEALDDAAGSDTILVLAHSDVLIADSFAAEKLDQVIGWADVIGVVGSAHFHADIDAAAYRWSVWPREALSGAVEHVYGSLTAWAVFGPTPRRCVILDGLLLAVDMLAIGPLRFDPQFRFHLYDLDFSLAAHRAGLVCATFNLYAQHHSRGDYDTPAYRDAAAAFRRKWAGVREQC
ncbi:MAG TPA: hypothetical protein VH253_18830 [Phycisphaerae bacterium]|nr:hypothetical protein [Phycisphaerae bacterium]